MSDILFLAKKEFDGKLVHEISSQFTATGVKITRTITNGKTFYLAKCVLIPDTDTVNDIVMGQTANINRNCFVDIKYDGTVIDQLMYNFESDSIAVSDPGAAADHIEKLNATATGKSLVGDGVKKVEVEVSATDGTAGYVVELLGWEENTGDDPII